MIFLNFKLKLYDEKPAHCRFQIICVRESPASNTRAVLYLPLDRQENCSEKFCQLPETLQPLFESWSFFLPF